MESDMKKRRKGIALLALVSIVLGVNLTSIASWVSHGVAFGLCQWAMVAFSAVFAAYIGVSIFLGECPHGD